MLDIINEKVIKSIHLIESGSDVREINFFETCSLIRQYYIQDPVFRLRFNGAFPKGNRYDDVIQDEGMKPLHHLVSLLSEKLYERE